MEHITCTSPTCDVCRRKDCFDFNVPDSIWQRVVPQNLRNKVICLCCFDELAKLKKVAYAKYLHKLYFAGQQATFEFEVVAAT